MQVQQVCQFRTSFGFWVCHVRTRVYLRIMPTESPRRRYSSQRNPKVPPHVSIGVLRRVSGLKLDDVADLVAEATGDRPTRGALSAIENGHRGASAQLIAGLEHAYGLPAGSISTTYVPRTTPAIEVA